MSQNVMAGIGGDGGDHNKAEGGDVDVKASIESANLNDVLNNSRVLPYRRFRHVCTADRRLRGQRTGGRGLPVLTSPRSRRTTARKDQDFRSLAGPQC